MGGATVPRVFACVRAWDVARCVRTEVSVCCGAGKRGRALALGPAPSLLQRRRSQGAQRGQLPQLLTAQNLALFDTTQVSPPRSKLVTYVGVET